MQSSVIDAMLVICIGIGEFKGSSCQFCLKCQKKFHAGNGLRIES